MASRRPIRLLLVGRQGAGKGTQCARISHRFAVPHIATGDMLRAAVQAGSPFGQKAKTFMDRGDLVPDEVIIGVMSERLAEPDAQLRGFVLDGFPRTIDQAEALEELLAPETLDLVVNLEVPVEVVLRRLASRRVCAVCGANYSDELRPLAPGICDHCGGELIQREDDTEAAILRRLEVYEAQTAPLLSFYGARGLLEVVDGIGEPEVVLERIIVALDRHGVEIDGGDRR